MTYARLLSPTTWLIIGFAGQAVFTARFLVQWIASERQSNSVVPVSFWWLSLAGGTTLFAYATYQRDPVIMVGQSMGLFIYTRNLMLVAKGRKRAGKRPAQSPAVGSPHRSGSRQPHREPARPNS